MNAVNAAPRQPERRASDASGQSAGEGRSRYFDPKFGVNAIRVLPGGHAITANPDEMLVTVLGSCVSACIRDPLTGIGGMNHFMLPESKSGSWAGITASMRYGNFAMDVLIGAIVKSGCPREKLEIKVFGGANVIQSSTLVGDQNGKFVREFLAAEGLTCSTFDLGGNHGRRLHYFPGDGKVNRLLLRRKSDVALLRDEQAYEKSLRGEPVQGDIELFGEND